MYKCLVTTNLPDLPLIDLLFEAHLSLMAAFHPKVLFGEELGGLKAVSLGAAV